MRETFAAPDPAASGRSRFLHGAIYHVLFDQPLAEVRKVVANAVPAASRVLDVACGTGELCFELAKNRNCQVVGVDLSPRMLAFARRRNRDRMVRFELGDGTDLARFRPDSFDIVTIVLLLHELSRDHQARVLHESLRLAPRVIAVDSKAPLPRNLHGLALRVVEALGGPGHYRTFAEYLAAGGFDGILADARVRACVIDRSVFWHGCRERLVLERSAKATV